MESFEKEVMEKEGISKHLKETICKEIIHGIEVSNLARLIGEELGLSKEECDELETAGIVHDIGKLKLAKYIYGEKGLIVEQMKYVRQHTLQSYEFVMDVGMSEKIANSVCHHHENYDGSGYPDNLKGTDIPLHARILRVCDVYVALVTDRSYRKAFDAQTAISIMIDEIKDYDMEVFLAFQKVIHNKKIEENIEQLKKIKTDNQRLNLEKFIECVNLLE